MSLTKGIFCVVLFVPMLVIGMPCFAARLHTTTLMQVFRDAANNDPVYQGQVANYQATAEELEINQAAIMPQINLDASINQQWQETSQAKSSFYKGDNFGLNLTETVFNYNQFKAIARAEYTVSAAAATLSAQEQDLMIRTAEAYYNVLQAKQLLIYSTQQKHFLAKQLDETYTRHQHGEATSTELEQARGAYYLMLNQYETDRLNVYDAIQSLSIITDKRYTRFARITHDLPLITPKPNNVALWLNKAERQNYDLLAARDTVMAAEKNISAVFGKDLPIVNLNASYNNEREPTTELDTIKAINTQTALLGVTATMPLSEGGLTHAEIKQAEALYQKAIADRRDRYQQVQADTRTAFEGIIIGKARILHAYQAMFANQKALRDAEEGYQSGTQTLTDILQIQTRLYASDQRYTRDVFTYLNDILLLKRAAGTLSVKSLMIQNSWLR